MTFRVLGPAGVEQIATSYAALVRPRAQVRLWHPAHTGQAQIVTVRDRSRREVAAGLATCARCGRPIDPGEPWDLGHDDLDERLYRSGASALQSRDVAEAAHVTAIVKPRLDLAPRLGTRRATSEALGGLGPEQKPFPDGPPGCLHELEVDVYERPPLLLKVLRALRRDCRSRGFRGDALPPAHCRRTLRLWLPARVAASTTRRAPASATAAPRRWPRQSPRCGRPFRSSVAT